VPAAATAYYFERFGFTRYRAPLIVEPPHPQLGMILVIPCFNESNLLGALNSLWRCERPECGVEVIVVVNSSESSSGEVLQRNERTLEEARVWAREDCDHYFRIHFLHTPSLPRKHAGVGLARKIGMDEALLRLDGLGRLNAPIVCFDADSTCDENYLLEIERYFGAQPKSPGCSIYFEHPLEGDEGPEIYEAITLYELHLRYYVEGLRFAGFPHAFHTIGSSMAVRAEAYMKQGGMNKRQAGEDFYFLHKIIPLGQFGEINATRVIPSPRPSDRVPFGTGRAVREYLETKKFETYPLEAFRDLKEFFGRVSAFGSSINLVAELSPSLQQFLADQNIAGALEEIRAHTTTPESFRDRFFRWFDGFRAMKYIHHARDTAYGSGEIIKVAANLTDSRAPSAADLLHQYRTLQREHGK
jgi:hypothetical protein